MYDEEIVVGKGYVGGGKERVLRERKGKEVGIIQPH